MNYLADIKNKKSDVIRIETNSFTRKELVAFVLSKFKQWEEFCEENKIEIVDEVKDEINKFIDLVSTSDIIESKHIKSRLVFGDETLESVSNRWKLEYKE